MKKIIAAGAALSLGVLSACGGNSQDAAGDVAEQEMQSTEDVLEERADYQDEIGNEAAEERLDARADAIGDASGDVEEAVEN